MKSVDWASEKQRLAFEYGPFPLCLSGGFGSAKTYALCMKGIWLSSIFPNNRGLIGRRVHKELKQTTQSTFFKICDNKLYDPQNGGRWNEQEGLLQFINGSTIYFVHMDQKDIEGIIKGLEINWFFLDQCEEIPEGTVNLLQQRLGRWDRVEVPQETILELGWTPGTWPWRLPSGKLQSPTYEMYACNPAGFDHYLYKRFHPNSDEHHRPQFIVRNRDGSPRRDETGELLKQSYRDRGYKLFNMKSYENKFLRDDYIAQLFTGGAEFVRRYVEGEWGFTEGQIHDVTPHSTLVTGERNGVWPTGTKVDLDQIISYIRNCCWLGRSMDYGDSAPTACIWFAVDKEGNVIVFREYYQGGQLISQHRKAITMLSEGEDYRVSNADPSIYYQASQRDGGRWTIADEWSDKRTLDPETAIVWQKADNNELGTRNRINEYLAINPQHIHPFTGKRGAPRLYFVMASDDYPVGVSKVYSETVGQIRKREGEVDGQTIWGEDRDPTIPDHAYDALRYAMASRPSRISLRDESAYVPNSFNEVAGLDNRRPQWRPA